MLPLLLLLLMLLVSLLPSRSTPGEDSSAAADASSAFFPAQGKGSTLRMSSLMPDPSLGAGVRVPTMMMTMIYTDDDLH
jgi:hypothetical protein